MTAGGSWSIRLAAAAEVDLRAILLWTRREFGARQAATYAETLSLALSALHHEGPQALGTRARPEVAPGISSLHVARAGRKGRHVIFFRIGGEDEAVIDVLRVLHEAMDVARHVTDADE